MYTDKVNRFWFEELVKKLCKDLIGEGPGSWPNQDEQGGCVLCGGAPRRGLYATKVEHHDETCPFRQAQNVLSELYSLEEVRIKMLKPCKAEIWHGPGHQSRSTCDIKGPHKQHSARGEFFWSKPRKGQKVVFSGFFDESPEREL